MSFMAPYSWIYNILPHYRIYNSKLISKKFPKNLKALLVDIQTMKGLDTVESLSFEVSGFTKTVGLYLQNLSKIFLVL